VVEERHELSSGPAGRRAFEASLAEEAGPGIRRRPMLGLLAAAGASLGLALLLPVLSLGPAPGNTLKTTPWRRGLRLVDEGGKPIRLDQLPVDGFITVFPEGHLDASDAQALLIRVPPNVLQLPPDRLAAAPFDNVAFSKLCTHAGCPVGLYQASTRVLFCPCHQSQFSVPQGAKRIFGPADRPLPQLPLTVDPDGYLIAGGDFYEPPGPAFWDRLKGRKGGPS
jgi:ubiquinol-cytochrome c reductase iron-sulfur subunit